MTKLNEPLNLFAPPTPKPWTPNQDQKQGVKFLLEHAAAGLLADPGTGKTSMSLAAFKLLKKQGLLEKALIIAPLRPCYLVWPKEIAKWADFNGLTYRVLHGPGKNEALKEDVDFHIINPDGLEWLTQATKSKTAFGRTKVDVDRVKFKSLGYDLLIVDELSKFKHTNTQRFKTLKHVIGLFQRRWGLTGSPASNGLMGLFGECYVLDEGRTFGQYITHYRSKFFNLGFDGYTWTLRTGADKEIFEKVKPLMLRMEARDLPELVESPIYVDLPTPARKVYDALEKDYLAKIDGKIVTAANAAVSSGKCRQVCNGGIYIDTETQAFVGQTEREWANLHTAKIDALDDLVDELEGQPLLVAYEFGHDLDRIRKKFGVDVPYIGGGVSPKRSVELEHLWNAGKLPLLFGQPQALAHGLNLQEIGHHVAWLGLTWDYELWDQFIRRIWRQGQRAKRVFVYPIIARRTVDEVVYNTVHHKAHGQNTFFEALKQYRKGELA